MRRVLVTGSNGFIGRVLCPVLRKRGFQVRGSVRRTDPVEPICEGIDVYTVGEVGPGTDWTEALVNVDAVVHLAGRAHVMRETAPDPLAVFRRVNTLGTEHLVRQAAATGVRRLVYVSSIGVNGNQTTGVPFSERDVPNPHDSYAVSKWDAEQALRRIAEDTGLEAAPAAA